MTDRSQDDMRRLQAMADAKKGQRPKNGVRTIAASDSIANDLSATGSLPQRDAQVRNRDDDAQRDIVYIFFFLSLSLPPFVPSLASHLFIIRRRRYGVGGRE